MVTRKSRAEIERDAPRRPHRRRGPRASSRQELKPGVSTAHLDRHRRGAHPQVRRDPVVQGLPGHQPATGRSRPASASRIDDEIVHGIPGDRTIRAGQIVSVDAGRHPRRLARRRGPDLLRRRPAGRGRRPHRARPGRPCWPASRRRCPGNHIEDISAAVEDVAMPQAAWASSASSSATGSAPRCTRSRRSPTSGPVVRAASSNPASASRSSRCSRSGGYEAHDPAGRLDRRHQRRLAGRPFRGLDRGDRARSRDPDGRCDPVVAGIGASLIRYAFVCRPAGPTLRVRKGST